MLAIVHSGTLIGIDVYSGMPSVTVVGLPAGAVKESTARLKFTIINKGYLVSIERITINPAPSGHQHRSDWPQLSAHKVDFKEAAGRESAKRAVEVAAAGSHNMLVLCL